MNPHPTYKPLASYTVGRVTHVYFIRRRNRYFIMHRTPKKYFAFEVKDEQDVHYTLLNYGICSKDEVELVLRKIGLIMTARATILPLLDKLVGTSLGGLYFEK